MPVRNLSAESFNASSIRITWESPSSGGYDYYRIFVGGMERVIEMKSLPFVFNGLIAGSLYDVTVQTLLYNVSSENSTQEKIPTCKFSHFL